MTLRHVWWFILPIQLLSVAFLVVAFWRYRRGGIRAPESFVSLVTTSVGGLLLIVSQLLVGANRLLSWIVLAVGITLIGYSMLRFRRARVRAL